MKTRVITAIVGTVLLLSCSMGRMPKHLAPEEQEFLSHVRYIISGKERKTFLSLPASERPRFIEEFWEKRDPNPATEENEFKVRYLKRIEEAKHLFTEGGTSGWLTDRGRVYVLLGPPEQRETYPRGVSIYGGAVPLEIWHYGFYRIRFSDTRWNGNFELEPGSAQLLAEINAAQASFQPRPRDREEDRALADFDLDIRLLGERSQLAIVSVPYRDIWFSLEGGKFKTTFELVWEVHDAEGGRIRQGATTAPMELTEEELKELEGREVRLEFPLELPPGEYQMTITLKNLTVPGRAVKKIKLTIETEGRRS
jgi:GWxTD domain-containing protein